MRKIQRLSMALLLLCSCGAASAQKKEPVRIVCATDEAIQRNFREHPEFKAAFEQKNKQSAQQRGMEAQRTTTLTAPVTIPVIVHVVLPNPTIVTEEQIDYLLNRLNTDFSGRNSDSINGSLFYNVRGHSLLRFTRARRTPAGQITNGIERRTGTLYISPSTYQPLKHAAEGGLDPWDITQYYNIWVGFGYTDATGTILGIAPGIGVGGQTETRASETGIDGVCIDAGAFSNGCFSYNGYNLARAAVHEIGHNFGLYHTFQTQLAGNCVAGNDFAQPTPGGQTLPTNLVGASADDTPALSEATTNCPTGSYASNCAGSPNPPGRMYQNHMDYARDACRTMFTLSQVERMHYMLETYRPGYLTTQGAVPPANYPSVDAAIGGFASPGTEFSNNNCTITSYPAPACPGAFTPRVQILNQGATTLTSVTIRVTLSGATTATQTITVPLNNLLTNRTQTIALPVQNLNLGTTTVTYTIIQANGVDDTYTANNTTSRTATIFISTLPFAQNFVGTAFPPANMSLANFSSVNSWVRDTTGNGNIGSAKIDNYNNNEPGAVNDIRTLPFYPPPNATSRDSVIITFDVAYKNFPGSFDELSVLVSNNCGGTFTPLYSKAGSELATAGASQDDYTTPIASDWRRERIAIGGAFLTGGPIIVTFRNTNDFGNNIFLDNINIVRKYERDITVSDITAPGLAVCSSTFTPQAVVTNIGTVAVDSFSVGYSVNNGAVASQRFNQRLNAGASATVNLPAATVGQTANNIRVFSFAPVAGGVSGDQQTSNDTLSKTFSAPTSLPLAQGFEVAPFPPSGWAIIGGAGPYTWVRDNHGRSSSWSAKVDNYNNDNRGQTVSLQTPPLRTTNLDSIVITFDVAYRIVSPAYADGLIVSASADCGSTFTNYYSKFGSNLSTANASTAEFLNPTQQQWRTERVVIPSTALNTGTAILRFTNVNDYGNNLFLDNINITGFYRREAQLVSINQPAGLVCTAATTPNVTVRNGGTDTIKAFKVAYVVDGGAPVITNFPSVNIVRNTSLTVALAPLNAAVGNHTFRAYLFDLITHAGSGDQNTVNDTLARAFTVISSVAAPLAESFDNTTFPPTGWILLNPDGATTWQRTTIASRTGTASAYMNNYNYPAGGSRDELYTPQIAYSGADSVFLSFDVAAATQRYPGSTELPLDTLEVLVSNDCGATLTSVYKKWGAELQTVGDPNSQQAAAFVPNGPSQWRNEQLNLSAYAARSPIQVVFRNTSNHDNNIFIDNVNVSTKALPARLKEQGYLIYPTPFSSSFYVQHYLPPTELRGVAVYNSMGQRVWAREYSTGTASPMLQVDMSRYANDIYTVVLRYTNRTVSQKIIKAR